MRAGGNNVLDELIQIQDPPFFISDLSMPATNPLVAALSAGAALINSCTDPTGKDLFGKDESIDPHPMFIGVPVAFLKPCKGSISLCNWANMVDLSVTTVFSIGQMEYDLNYNYVNNILSQPGIITS